VSYGLEEPTCGNLKMGTNHRLGWERGHDRLSEEVTPE
jgi:hypothetical protein